MSTADLFTQHEEMRQLLIKIVRTWYSAPTEAVTISELLEWINEEFDEDMNEIIEYLKSNSLN